MNDWIERYKKGEPPLNGDEKRFWICAHGIERDFRDFRIILREARQIWNYTQKDFADSLGISVKHLNRIENCHQYPSIPLLDEMCSKLGYTIELKFNLVTIDDRMNIGSRFHKKP